jgi:hypothetical protein
MSVPVNVSFTAPDPDVAPATFAEAVDQLNELVVASVETELGTFVQGVDVPPVDDQDKLWFRFNTIGAPVAWYAFRLGVWAREEPPISARWGIFTGDPTEFFDANGKGLKGAGPIAGDYWGWHLTNGLGGTPNWSNKFLIGGAMDNVGIIGFAGGWRTNINGAEEATGGVAEITLDADNTFTPGVVVGGHDATGSTGSPGGPLYGTGSDITLVGVNEDPAPISVVPPFYAVAYVVFTGYID